MLESELKKLKVVELRSRLKELGLDWRGVKAELVARLISAAESGVEAASLEAEPCQSNPGSSLELSSEVLPDQSEHRSHGYVDQSTQTENIPTDNTSLLHPSCSCSSGGKQEHRQLSTEKHSQGQLSSPEVQPRGQEALPDSSASPTHPDTGPDAVHVVCSSSTSLSTKPGPSNTTTTSTTDDYQLPDTPTDTSESRMEGQDEDRNTRRPPEEKGRGYYEFKEEVHYIRAKTPEPGPESEDEMEVDDDDVVKLDPYNTDLHFEVNTDGCSGQNLLWDKFPLLRSGCRVTHGFTQGKVGFEVKFVKKLAAATVDMSVDPEPHVLRVGWSVDSTSLQLGKEELSYGLDGTGKTVTGEKEEEFGEPFSEGDVIGCYAMISEGGEAELSFYKNGHALGVAFSMSSSVLSGRALYPHILCKNCSVSLNLDPQATEWYPGPPGFCPLPVLPSDQLTRAPLPPTHRKDCEVLMMVGMPGSGKSHWVQNHIAKNPDKRYNVLSTNTILHSMKMPGPQHKELMLQKATQCLTHLVKIAANKRRNFILDQANIYPSARKHKMLRFHGYQRKAVVVVPSDAEWRRRLQQLQQEEGVEVPEASLLKSRASFTLPEQGELLEEVVFVELGCEEAQSLLTNYKEEARRLLPAPPKRKKSQHKNLKPHMNPRGRAYGWSRSSCNHPIQRGYQKQYGWHPSTFVQPYGCNSDPQRYRDYYQPCTGQWNVCEQSQSYYSNQDYFGNQGFW